MNTTITQLAERLGTDRTTARRVLKNVGFPFPNDRKKVYISDDFITKAVRYYEVEKQNKKPSNRTEIEILKNRVLELETDKRYLQQQLDQTTKAMIRLTEERKLLIEAPKKKGILSWLKKDKSPDN